MPGIIINNLSNELLFTEYLRRRGEIRDAMRFGVYPAIKAALALYARFQADYAPSGTLYDPELWQYYLNNARPVADAQADLITAGEMIVGTMEAIERAAPGTFGIDVSPLPVPPEGGEPILPPFPPVGEEGVGDGGEEPQP